MGKLHQRITVLVHGKQINASPRACPGAESTPALDEPPFLHTEPAALDEPTAPERGGDVMGRGRFDRVAVHRRAEMAPWELSSKRIIKAAGLEAIHRGFCFHSLECALLNWVPSL